MVISRDSYIAKYIPKSKTREYHEVEKYNSSQLYQARIIRMLLQMAVVKLTKKQKLDELAARLTIDLKKKVSLQELLDLCIELAFENYDQVAEALRGEKETLTAEKIKAIRAIAVSFEEDSKGSINEDVYS